VDVAVSESSARSSSCLSASFGRRLYRSEYVQCVSVQCWYVLCLLLASSGSAWRCSWLEVYARWQRICRLDSLSSLLFSSNCQSFAASDHVVRYSQLAALVSLVLRC